MSVLPSNGVQSGVSNYTTFMNNLSNSLSNLNNNFNFNNNIPSMARMADAANIGGSISNYTNTLNSLTNANPVAKIASWGNTAANTTANIANQWNQLTGLGLTNAQIQQLINNQSQQIQNQGYNQQFSNWLGAGQLALSGLAGLGSYFNSKSYLNTVKDQMNQQNQQFNETYNNRLKQMNKTDANILRARAHQETGDSHAYDDEIAANAYTRGHTGTDSSENDYLSYKRGSNA